MVNAQRRTERREAFRRQAASTAQGVFDPGLAACINHASHSIDSWIKILVQPHVITSELAGSSQLP